MKRFTTIAAAGAAAAVGAGAFALPALASGTSATHTLHFTAVSLKDANFSKNQFGQAEKDVRNGKIIGFDVVYGRFHPATNSARGRVAVSTRGGLLYGKLKFSNGPITTGTVTGGTGRFAGATGTIYGKSLNKSGTRTAVTVHWHR